MTKAEIRQGGRESLTKATVNESDTETERRDIEIQTIKRDRGWIEKETTSWGKRH